MKKLKFKKLLNEYRSLSYELEYMKEAMVIANDQFETYYREYCRKNNISISDLETKNKPKVKQIFQKAAIDKKKIQEVMSKKDYDHKGVFKEIARKIHPDKLQSDDPRYEEYETSFKQAADAMTTGKWGSLFDIAEKYDIDIKDYASVNNSLREDIKRIKVVIEKEKSRYGWLLFDCEDNENCKENVIKQYLKHLFNHKII